MGVLSDWTRLGTPQLRPDFEGDLLKMSSLVSGFLYRRGVRRPGPSQRRSLEELVDRLIETLFPAQTIHEARRLRQSGDVDGGLAVFDGMNMAKATPRESRWAFSEWRQLAKWRFGGQDALLYRQGTGRAAVLVSRADGMLEVVALLGDCTVRPGTTVRQL